MTVCPASHYITKFDMETNCSAGNCFFRALSHQLYATEEQHSEIRSRMSKLGTYADEPEMVAFAHAYQIDLKLFQEDDLPQYDYLWQGNGIRAVVAVARHREQHFSSVRRLVGPHFGKPEVYLARTLDEKYSDGEMASSDGGRASTPGSVSVGREEDDDDTAGPTAKKIRPSSIRQLATPKSKLLKLKILKRTKSRSILPSTNASATSLEPMATPLSPTISSPLSPNVKHAVAPSLMELDNSCIKEHSPAITGMSLPAKKTPSTSYPSFRAKRASLNRRPRSPSPDRINAGVKKPSKWTTIKQKENKRAQIRRQARKEIEKQRGKAMEQERENKAKAKAEAEAEAAARAKGGKTVDAKACGDQQRLGEKSAARKRDESKELEKKKQGKAAKGRMKDEEKKVKKVETEEEEKPRRRRLMKKSGEPAVKRSSD